MRNLNLIRKTLEKQRVQSFTICTHCNTKMSGILIECMECHYKELWLDYYCPVEEVMDLIILTH